jgi:uncharacterized protein (DUF302 family)
MIRRLLATTIVFAMTLMLGLGAACVAFARECRIFEVCTPQQAKKVLEANLEISTALPCRISVYEDGRATKLATIKPTAMIALYATPALRAVAEEVESTLRAIMAEAAR